MLPLGSCRGSGPCCPSMPGGCAPPTPSRRRRAARTPAAVPAASPSVGPSPSPSGPPGTSLGVMRTELVRRRCCCGRLGFGAAAPGSAVCCWPAGTLPVGPAAAADCCTGVLVAGGLTAAGGVDACARGDPPEPPCGVASPAPTVAAGETVVVVAEGAGGAAASLLPVTFCRVRGDCGFTGAAEPVARAPGLSLDGMGVRARCRTNGHRQLLTYDDVPDAVRTMCRARSRWAGGLSLAAHRGGGAVQVGRDGWMYSVTESAEAAAMARKVRLLRPTPLRCVSAPTTCITLWLFIPYAARGTCQEACPHRAYESQGPGSSPGGLTPWPAYPQGLFPEWPAGAAHPAQRGTRTTPTSLSPPDGRPSAPIRLFYAIVAQRPNDPLTV